MEEQKKEYLPNQDIWETGDIVKICGIEAAIIDCVNCKASFGNTFVLNIKCEQSEELEEILREKNESKI